MALTDENGGMNTTMLVTPANSANQGNGNNMFGDGNSWWFILLFIILLGGGMWGNNAGNNGGFGGGQPIIVTENAGSSGNAVQKGFDQAAVMDGINGLQTGLSGLSTQLCESRSDIQNTVSQGFFGVQNALCNGFAGVSATVNGGFANAETAANARQMANMQQAFAAQAAMSQGFNAAQSTVNQGFNQLGSQLADCCCENRLGTADLKYTIATENCADRTQAMQNTRDIIDSQTRSTQAILDKLCQLELDGVKQNYENRITTLQNALDQSRSDNQGLRFAASQVAQDGRIVDGVYNRLATCPVGTMPVYGNQPIFTCPNNNSGCGCGCGSM